MAKTGNIAPKKLNKKTIKRKGIVAKKGSSTNKNSKLYRKPKVSQGV